MSKWDKLIIAAAVIALALFVYVMATEQMQASFVSENAIAASADEGRFNEISRLIENGSLSETQFAKTTSGDIGDYYLVDYTLTLKSACPIQAKWATMNLEPVGGDVVLMQSAPASVMPFGEATVTGTLLTTNPDAKRRGVIEYYVLGRMMTAAVELG